MKRRVFSIAVAFGVACGGGNEPKTPATIATTTSPAPPKLGPPIDEATVKAATGADKAEVDPAAVKVSFPRADVDVLVDGWKLPPFMGLTSWAAFAPAREGVAEAMVMGDLVLFEDEVGAVMSVLLDSGVAVTALHNHFFLDTPKVYFLHIGGEGAVADLGKGVKLAMEKVAEIRKKTPKPSSTLSAAPLPAKSSLDAAKLEGILGRGTAKEGMWKFVVGRLVQAACGCTVGKSMGVTTWAAFAGEDANAIVDGDFAVTEAELQPVLKELRRGGIHVVAIHHHMSGESPRLLFVHYWGRGKAEELARAVQRTLDKTGAMSSPR